STCVNFCTRRFFINIPGGRTRWHPDGSCYSSWRGSSVSRKEVIRWLRRKRRRPQALLSCRSKQALLTQLLQEVQHWVLTASTSWNSARRTTLQLNPCAATLSQLRSPSTKTVHSTSS